MTQVYFARQAKTRLIKIGYSKVPERRITEMQTGSGDTIQLVLTVPGNHTEERAFHQRFRDCHERGEWFREEGSLLKFLKAKKLDSASLNTAAERLSETVLTWGYCKNPQELDELYAFGLSDSLVYMQGRGAETLDACLANFRGRPGWLILACDIRIFGEKRPQIIAVMDRLETAHIRVTDISHPEDNTHTKMLVRGTKAAAMMRFTRNTRLARRIGAKGGHAKGVAAAADRAKVLADDIIRRLCAHPKLQWKDRLEILGASFNKATLIRHYR